MKTQEKKNHKVLKGFLLVVLCAFATGLVASVVIKLSNRISDKKEEASFGIEVIEEYDDIDTAKETVSENALYANITESDEDLEAETMVLSSDVSAIVKNVMPAIVSIDCVITVKQSDFFGYSREYEAKSCGSGFIIGQNNMEILLATNNHVVEDAKEISVTFNDGKSVKATVKGTDPMYDLAVVSVNAKDLEKSTISKIKVATLGDSDLVKDGDMTIAIGNALGYGQSVTVGYVGALNREVVIDGISRTLLQTDAAINPGNSGGALLDVRGAVIGINSAKYSDTAVEGLGYAIPISVAIPIINDLMNREILTDSEAGYLGIQGKDIRANDVQSFGMPVGIYVYSVYKDTPAEEAGLKTGDIIVAINDRKLTTMEELRTILGYTRAGTTVTLTLNVLENGSYVEKKLDVVLGSRKKDE